MENNKDRTYFESQIYLLAKIFDKTVDVEIIEIYWEALKHLNIETFSLCVKKCIESCEFFPRPADFIKFSKQTILPEYLRHKSRVELILEERNKSFFSDGEPKQIGSILENIDFRKTEK